MLSTIGSVLVSIRVMVSVSPLDLDSAGGSAYFVNLDKTCTISGFERLPRLFNYTVSL